MRLWGSSAGIAILIATTAFAAEPVLFRPLDVYGCPTAIVQRCVTLEAPLAEGTKVTTLDLLRDLYPGLDSDLTGEHYAGADLVDNASDEGAGDAEDRAVDLTVAGGLPEVAVIGDGATTWAGVLTAGVLIFAEVAPEVRVLGRLVVQTDPGGLPDGRSGFLLAPGRPALLIENSHFNSQEGFSNFMLVGPDGKGGLADLYDGPSLYSLLEASEDCDSFDRRQELFAFAPSKGRHGGVADIAALVRETVTCRLGDSETVRGRTDFPMRLRFDARAGVYRGGSDALDRRNAAAFGVE